MNYEKAIELSVQKESETIGPVAEAQANQIDGVEIEDGDLELSRDDGKQALQEVVEKLKTVAGDVASNLMAQELKEEMDPDKDELPEELAERI